MPNLVMNGVIGSFSSEAIFHAWGKNFIVANLTGQAHILERYLLWNQSLAEGETLDGAPEEGGLWAVPVRKHGDEEDKTIAESCHVTVGLEYPGFHVSTGAEQTTGHRRWSTGHWGRLLMRPLAVRTLGEDGQRWASPHPSEGLHLGAPLPGHQLSPKETLGKQDLRKRLGKSLVQGCRDDPGKIPGRDLSPQGTNCIVVRSPSLFRMMSAMMTPT
ncbi:uncharacterized protein LOC120227895 [Hyaena hyaena]|uniref:uncharacterized protein LOC120227895 n=1 Tax=Hyaena hyaena TaxID=95912 RepID=UPI0019239C15|nr:uncharacterized protein LOC120227895 [Hyaena hyaena]